MNWQALSGSRRRWSARLGTWTAALGATLLAASALAESVDLSVQGRLTSTAGGAVADGVYGMALVFYDAPSGGNAAFKEQFIAVPVVGGVFALALGAADTKLDSAVFAPGKPLWVGVTVGSDPELPRQALRRVPFAVQASVASLAGDLQCSGCVGTDDIAKSSITGEKIAQGAVGANHVSFTWAAGDSPGGAATFALAANTAKLADQAKLADAATFAEEAATAKLSNNAKGLQCTGCVGVGQLAATVPADWVAAGKLAAVATSGKYADLQGGPDLSGYAALAGANSWTKGQTWQAGGVLGADLDFAKHQALLIRIHNAASAPAACDASMEGGLYYDTVQKRFFGCNGAKWQAFTAGVNSVSNPALSCLALLQSGEGKASGLYWVKPAKASTARQVYCEQEKAGGGWALVLHVFGHSGMSENKFTAAAGHNRFTDANWNLVSGNIVVGASAEAPQPGKVTGGIDIAFFDGGWTDLRAACSQKTGDLTEQAFGVVPNFTTANGNYKLLAAANNGKAYAVDKALNSSGNTTIWVDNETTTENSGHYLCDTYNGGTNGTSQLSLCYTDFLNNDNSQDMGDSIVALGFGTTKGDDGWSAGFSGECGPMGAGYLGDAGTFSYWVR